MGFFFYMYDPRENIPFEPRQEMKAKEFNSIEEVNACLSLPYIEYVDIKPIIRGRVVNYVLIYFDHKERNEAAK